MYSVLFNEDNDIQVCDTRKDYATKSICFKIMFAASDHNHQTILSQNWVTSLFLATSCLI